MYFGKTFMAIIPARGGSKGIPKKNLTLVDGKPLIQYTIDEAKQSKYLDTVIVSTDDQEIANVSKECGVAVPFLRPKSLASDNSKTIDAIIYTINKLTQNGNDYDYVVLLQPTQPLRKYWHIDGAIEKIINKNVDSLVSVSEVKDHPSLIRTINNDEILGNLININSTIRRQDFPVYYKVNGAIYINKLNEKFSSNTSLNDNKLAYIMDRSYDLDIDEPIDLELFKLLIK
ncbi:cytidylyltransferase domain-containing protein [Aquibacillus albus]|uniref:CMP-N,N'-diacetyllegionaminic acid synthase n=1 Tax=Aquibacillus albus TaxID=1168171 RepID=A0ABS2N4W8_9BACI|nr:acylneuraminate cytidylyltransferase family protein [Aquibacillus albus]MBM7573191.1 CMP-N,N'-diacetyllegionaminic acid synthase [Aquibacillus albus]